MARITNSTSLAGRIDTFLGMSLQIIGLTFGARLIMDTGNRMLYPFIPQFAEGLGLSVVGFSWLIFMRTIVGLAGPIFGILSDRYGRRRIMAVGLLCESVGALGVALAWQWWASLPMIFLGLSLTAFLPPQQAYISDQAPYHKRGRALAIIEFSWALVAIAILPIVGWLIELFGWRAPFFFVALVSLIGATVIWLRLPPATHHSSLNLSWPEVRRLCLRLNVLAAVSVTLLLFVAVSAYLSIWGIWLSAEFDLDAAALGLVATGTGLAELVGSGLSGLFIDRFGKRRGGSLGQLLSAILLLLLPLTGHRFLSAILVLILLGTLLEFTVVSMIPLYSEQVPTARGMVFSLILLGASLGGAIGTPITAMLWEQSGLWAVCMIAATCLLVACGITWKFLHEAAQLSPP